MTVMVAIKMSKCECKRPSWLNFRNLIFSVLFIVCVIQISQLVNDFISGEKWTNSMLQKDVTELEFPYVTICNYNQVNMSKLNELATEAKLQHYIDQDNLTDLYKVVNDQLDYMTLQDHLLATIYTDGLNSHVINSKYVSNGIASIENIIIGRHLYRRLKEDKILKNIRDALFQLAIPCRSTLVMCSFFGGSFDCCKNSQQVVRDIGACFVIRPPNTGDVSSPPVQGSQGNVFGFKFFVGLHTNIGSKRILNNFMDSGLRMYITYQPDDMLMEHLSAPDGFHTFISLEKVEKKTIDPGGSIILHDKMCSSESKTEFLKRNYSVVACQIECWLKMDYKTCNCITADYFSDDLDVPMCEPDDYYGCVMPNITENKSAYLAISSVDSPFNMCKRQCKQPCYQQRIKASSSMTKMPTPHVIPQLVRAQQRLGYSVTEKDITNGILAIDMSFKRLSYHVIEKYPKATLEQMIGNIGGLLGLWLGTSILSMIDVLKLLSWNRCCTSGQCNKNVNVGVEKAAQPKEICDICLI